MANSKQATKVVRDDVRGQNINIYTVQDLNQRDTAKVATILYTVTIKDGQPYLVCSNSDVDIEKVVGRLSRFRTIENGEHKGQFALGIGKDAIRLVTPSELKQIPQGFAKRQRGGIFHAHPPIPGETVSGAMLAEGKRIVISYYNQRTDAQNWTMAVYWATVETLALPGAVSPPVKRPAVATEAVPEVNA